VHNEITDDGLILLINVLPKIPLLEHLEIDRNNMTSSVYELLTNTLNTLPNIKRVHIEQTMASHVAWENIPHYYALCS
jgi:Ran GTPase-activating protein (RanGAP) involved in mRNA processing and transport